MKKCLAKNISIGLISVGSFLLGASFGLKISEWGEEEPDDCLDDEFFDTAEPYDCLIGEETQNMIDDLNEKFYSRLSKTLYKDPLNEEDTFDEEEIEPIINSITIGGEEVPITKDNAPDPMVISEDLYFNDNEYSNYVSETLIYYEGDDTLADEKDSVIYDIDNVVGTEALTSFGSMTTDKDTVFVINHKMKIKYEIVRDEGKYTELVLGIPDEEPDYEEARKFFKKFEDDGEE